MQENIAVIPESLSGNTVTILMIVISGYLARRWIIPVVLGAVLAVFAVGLATVLTLTT